MIGEFLYGARHSTNAASNLEHVAFAAAIVGLPADQQTAEVYASLAKGGPIPDNDLWIAATTIQQSARADEPRPPL